MPRDPTRYLIRAGEVLLYGLACAGFLWCLSDVAAANQPLTLLQAVTLGCLAGLVVMVVRATR